MQNDIIEVARIPFRGSDSRIVLAGDASRISAPLERDEPPRRVDMLVCDHNTAEILPPDVDIPRVVLPPGERCKDFDVLRETLDCFLRARLSRDSVVAAFGGGAVTDLGACAASIYLRGIDFVLIPTSLLAMVDAAIGGKTGIDFGGYKNIVGTFAPAAEVRLIPALLATLSEGEYRNGLAEVLKAAFLDDDELLTILDGRRKEVLDRDPRLLEEIIVRSVRVKARIVADDLTERGRRAVLNLGHTFGHALESVLGFDAIAHGEAVAWGIARAMRAGEAAGITDAAWARRVTALLAAYGYETDAAVEGAEADALYDAMQRDKKRYRDGLRFVLQTGPQDTVLEVLPEEVVRDVLTG
ncbi:MAG: 3-dehydroquinate synthase [Spirochaetales bacterium]|nr:3-dehydroquinate synthase [Spirochaetales bacterium]